MLDDTQRALAIVARVSGRETVPFDPTTELVADLGLDSLKAIELVLELEEAFSLQLRDQDVRGIRTLGDVLQALSNARSAPGGA